PTTLPPGPRPPPAGAVPPPRLLRPPPRVRVPDVAHEVGVLLVVLQSRLRAFDVDVIENRQDGKVLVEDRLDLLVNRLPLLLAVQFCWRNAWACSRTLFPAVVELLKLSLMPFFARIPSPPTFHPASSRRALALSGLYSCFGRSGLNAHDDGAR